MQPVPFLQGGPKQPKYNSELAHVARQRHVERVARGYSIGRRANASGIARTALEEGVTLGKARYWARKQRDAAFKAGTWGGHDRGCVFLFVPRAEGGALTPRHVEVG